MLTYDTLLAEALNAFPDFKQMYNKLVAEDVIDSESGNHIVFSYAFVPVLVDAIQTGKDKLVTEMLAFVEEMAKCEDPLVGEVCDFTILEELNDVIDDAVLVPLLGKEALVDFKLIKRYME